MIGRPDGKQGGRHAVQIGVQRRDVRVTTLIDCHVRSELLDHETHVLGVEDVSSRFQTDPHGTRCTAEVIGTEHEVRSAELVGDSVAIAQSEQSHRRQVGSADSPPIEKAIGPVLVGGVSINHKAAVSRIIRPGRVRVLGG